MRTGLEVGDCLMVVAFNPRSIFRVRVSPGYRLSVAIKAKLRFGKADQPAYQSELKTDRSSFNAKSRSALGWRGEPRQEAAGVLHLKLASRLPYNGDGGAADDQRYHQQGLNDAKIHGVAREERRGGRRGDDQEETGAKPFSVVSVGQRRQPAAFMSSGDST